MAKHKTARRVPKHKHHENSEDASREEEKDAPMAVASEFGAPGSGFADAMARILGRTLRESSDKGGDDEEEGEEEEDDDEEEEDEGGAGTKRKRDLSRAERKARAKARKEADDERAARAAAAASGSGSGVILAKRKTKQLKLIAEARKEAREAKKRRKTKLALAARSTPVVAAEFTEKERQLRKVATQGVVALFNAIKEHQGLLKSDTANGVEERKERKSASAVAESITSAKAASGDDFLDMLRGTGGGGEGKKSTEKEKGKGKKKKMKKAKKSGGGAAWMAGDYMMTSSMKGFSDALEGDDD